MGYTSSYARQTAEHIESDTWRNTRGHEMRIHRYRCRACGKVYMYANDLYERCPYCGAPILHYRKAC